MTVNNAICCLQASERAFAAGTWPSLPVNYKCPRATVMERDCGNIATQTAKDGASYSRWLTADRTLGA